MVFNNAVWRPLLFTTGCCNSKVALQTMAQYLKMYITHADMIYLADLRECDVFLQKRRHDGGVALSRYAGYISSPRLLKAPKPAPFGDTQTRKVRYGMTKAKGDVWVEREDGGHSTKKHSNHWINKGKHFVRTTLEGICIMETVFTKNKRTLIKN